MTHVVTEMCIKCKYTDCVAVCPTECFHEGSNFLAINPEECIDCGLCVSECPVMAIVEAKDLPEDQLHWIEINESLSRSWPLIVRRKSVAPEAEKWAKVQNKFPLLER
ncbi:MAG: ferredoxin family protein [Burkholderiaceae bacterium]|nr:ferredoxin family protein [Burkholderiaceae bacterium]